MHTRSRFHALGAFVLALLLALPAAGQAATAPAPSVLTSIPAIPNPFTQTPVLTPPASSAGQSVLDRGLEALGGYSGLEQLQAAAREKQAVAARAAVPQVVTAQQYQPAFVPSGKAAPQTTAQAVPVTDPRARRHLSPDLVWPPLPGDSGVKATGSPTAASLNSTYDLVLSCDVFGTSQGGNITATVTYYSAPVAGATVRVGDGGPTYTTDQYGSVTFNFQAPDYEATIPVYVSTESQPETKAGELYSVGPGHGVAVIENVTDWNGQPFPYFHTYLYNQSGEWGYGTNQGHISIIVPAGTAYAEVRSTTIGGPGFLLMQSFEVPAGGKGVIHPSAVGAAHVRLDMRLDGTLRPAEASLHNEALPYETMYGPVPQDVYVTPGTYTVVLRSTETPQSALLTRQGAPLTSDTSLELAGATDSMDQVRLAFTDGTGASGQVEGVILATASTKIFVRGPSSLLVEPNRAYNLDEYWWRVQEGETEWDYSFWSEQRAPFGFATPGESYSLNMGGPLVARSQLNGCQSPGCSVGVYTVLFTSANDDQLWGQWRTPNANQVLPGTLSLQDESGTVREMRNIDISTWWQWFTLPSDADGAWSLRLNYPDLGPYTGHQGYEKVWPFSVQQMPVYAATTSVQMLDPGVPTLVSVSVTADGQPAAGVDLTVGGNGEYGRYTTRADGTVTFTITAYGRREIPIYVNTTAGSRRVAYLYSVPAGYGVVYLESVTDQAGVPVNSFYATASWFPRGGWDIAGFGGSGGTGVVRPAGTNYLEVVGYANNATYFLYRDVTVGDHQYVPVTLSGAGTVPVNVSASLDGAPVSPAVQFHNQRMDGTSWVWNWTRLPAQNLQVTPGTYTVLVETDDGNPLLLTRENVDLTAPATVDFAANRAGLAELNVELIPGANPNLTVNDIRWKTPQFRAQVNSPRVLATPGIPYYVAEYAAAVNDGQGRTWNYWFENERTTTPSVPAPGQQVTVNVAGPLHIELAPNSDDLIPGNQVWFHAALMNNEGDQLTDLINPYGYLNGSLILRDAAGNVLWSRPFYAWEGSTPVSLPSAPGTYTLTAAFDTGPYQGPISQSYTFTLDSPVALTLSRQWVPSATPTDVTVTASRNGTPAPGVTVALTNGMSQTTDAAGQATFHLTQYGSTVMQVEARSSSGSRLARANLFVLGDGEAGIEIGGTDVNGQPLTYFSGSAEVVNAFTSSRWTNWADTGLAGTIVPAGHAYVELNRSGQDAYLLNTQLEVAGRQVYTVRFDGAQSTPLNISTTFDGAPLSSPTVALHSQIRRTLSSADGLELDSTGQGIYHVTPGKYTAMLQGTTAGMGVAATLGTIDTATSAYQFDVHSGQLERLEFHITYQGRELTDAQFFVTDKAFEWGARTPVTLTTPGSYAPSFMDVRLDQGNGETWLYELTPKGGQSIDLVLGKPWVMHQEFQVTNAAITASHFTFQPGEAIQYMQEIGVGPNWAIRWVYNVTPYGWGERAQLSARILDADGKVVDTPPYVSPWNNGWITPKVNPSSAYTVEVSRDLGRLGQWVTTATYTLVQPKALSLRLDKEMLTVGQYNQVHTIVTVDNQPAAYVWILIEGETMQWRRTDGRGVLEFNVKPTRAGAWTFSYTEGSSRAAASAYALAPGYGLLDLAATDRTGRPLTGYYAKAVSPTFPVQGYQLPDQGQKLVVPAGPVQLVVRGYSADGDNYYLTGSATVPSLGSVRVALSGADTAPIAVSVANVNPDTATVLYMRNTAMPYQEQNALPYSLHAGSTIYATSGTYELLAQTIEPNTWRVIPLPDLTVGAGPNSIAIDAAAAASLLSTGAVDGQLQTGTDASLFMQHGSIMYYVTLDNASIYLAPGSYRFVGGRFSLADQEQNRTYTYHFGGGTATMDITDGTPARFVLGGPLMPESPTLTLTPATATANGKFTATARLRTQSGLSLSYVETRDNVTGQRGWLANAVEVTGNGYTSRTEFFGSSTSLTAPATPGSYSVTFTQPLGPYQKSFGSSGILQVIRLNMWRP